VVAGLCVATLAVGDDDAAEDALEDAVVVIVDGADGEFDADPVIDPVLLVLGEKLALPEKLADGKLEADCEADRDGNALGETADAEGDELPSGDAVPTLGDAEAELGALAVAESLLTVLPLLEVVAVRVTSAFVAVITGDREIRGDAVLFGELLDELEASSVFDAPALSVAAALELAVPLVAADVVADTDVRALPVIDGLNTADADAGDDAVKVSDTIGETVSAALAEKLGVKEGDCVQLSDADGVCVRAFVTVILEVREDVNDTPADIVATEAVALGVRDETAVLAALPVMRDDSETAAVAVCGREADPLPESVLVAREERVSRGDAEFEFELAADAETLGHRETAAVVEGLPDIVVVRSALRVAAPVAALLRLPVDVAADVGLTTTLALAAVVSDTNAVCEVVDEARGEFERTAVADTVADDVELSVTSGDDETHALDVSDATEFVLSGVDDREYDGEAVPEFSVDADGEALVSAESDAELDGAGLNDGDRDDDGDAVDEGDTDVAALDVVERLCRDDGDTLVEGVPDVDVDALTVMEGVADG
jgi:hypothetical protein